MFENIKKAKAPPNKNISNTRVSTIPTELEQINIARFKTIDLLKKISNEYDPVKCIETIVNETADGKQALNTYLRLAHQGFKVEWRNSTTNRLTKKYDSQFREWSSTACKNNAMGIDGLLDSLHNGYLTRGGMATEVVVSKDLKSIDEIAIVDVSTIKDWKYDKSIGRYRAYQQRTDNKKVDLFDGNFFYIPYEPKTGSPIGTLKFEPTIHIVAMQLKLINDSLKVLERIGYPRYKALIDKAKFVDALIDKSEESVDKNLDKLFASVEKYLQRLQAGSDFISTDDITLDVIGGGVNGAGVDVRAWFEVMDILVCNAFQLPLILMGRQKSGSYALGTVQFKVVVDEINSMRRASKRMLEDIFKMWARVNGYNIYPVVKLDPLNWQDEKDKAEIELKKLEISRRAEEYGYISKDEACIRSIGEEKADNYNDNDLYAYLRAVNRTLETTTDNNTNDDLGGANSE